MDLVIVPGPGNGKELMDSLAWTQGANVRLAREPEDLEGADLIVTPRGPSRSFSEWYLNDALGQAVLAASRQGVPWIAFCGSALPLSAELGEECQGVTAQSLVAMKGRNNRLFGPGKVAASDDRVFRFHFTSAPSFEAMEGTETLAATNGDGSVLRADDIVVSSGLPVDQDGWAFLFEAVGVPIHGARIG